MGHRSGGNLIKNCDVAANAAIAPSKLGAGTLSSTLKVADANVASDAAIALSKLATGALPSAITVADANVTASAAIALSKLATGTLPSALKVARTNFATGLIAARVVAGGTPAGKAGGINDVATARAANSATNTFSDIASPDVPRNVRVAAGAGWDGGIVTVNGTDQFDAVVAETFAQADIDNATKVGVKIFKTVTSVTKASVGESAAEATVGVGDKIGVTPALANAVGVLLGDATIEAVTLDATYSAFTPTTTPNGAVVFHLIANF